MKGRLRDELGVRHSSGHHDKPAYWEVLNGPEYEHNFGAEEYTKLHDAITSRLPHIDSHLKFSGASLAIPDHSEEFFNYFLDPSRHAPHSRIDTISYHFYALEKKDESLDQVNTTPADLQSSQKIPSGRIALSPFAVKFVTLAPEPR